MSPELWTLFEKETNIQLVGTLFHHHTRFLVIYKVNFDPSHNQVEYLISTLFLYSCSYLVHVICV